METKATGNRARQRHYRNIHKHNVPRARIAQHEVEAC